MAVDIKVSGNPDSVEFRCAEWLRHLWGKELPPGSTGSIHIVSNVQLFGQNPRDVDLIVLGLLEGAVFTANTASRQCPDDVRRRNVLLHSFCFTIELKQHDPQNIEMRGTNVIVRYSGDKLRDATSQSEDQKYSLLNYLKLACPDQHIWICNFLWLLNMSSSAVNGLVGTRPHNILPDKFTLTQLLSSALVQKAADETSNPDKCIFRSLFPSRGVHEVEAFSSLIDCLTGIRPAVGILTRRNVERITSRELLVPETVMQAIGQKIVVIEGRAGTGKTIKLLHIGCKLASEQGKRCLLLTYNNVLANDIQRTLFLANVPSDFDSGCMTILTVHEFVRKLALALGLILPDDYQPEHHENICSNIVEFIDGGAITQEDIIALMNERQELTCWDLVLIDEAQDFSAAERALLLRTFSYRRLVIADGIDQFVRGKGRLDWGKNIYVVRTKERRSLRQKRNLATFVNAYAQAINVPWNVEVVPQLSGGRIIVSSQPLPYDCFSEVRDRCYAEGNKAFEMLFLVPPCMVWGKEPERGFKFQSDFAKKGFQIWDGTRPELRRTTVPAVSQHRLLQYDSCRGIEGWCVVCLEFDKLVEYKRSEFLNRATQVDGEPSNALLDPSEACDKFAGLWSLMPLTRAIDTLVITFDDLRSPILEYMRSCSDEDIVEFI